MTKTDPDKEPEPTRDALAALLHEQWSGWVMATWELLGLSATNLDALLALPNGETVAAGMARQYFRATQTWSQLPPVDQEPFQMWADRALQVIAAPLTQEERALLWNGPIEADPDAPRTLASRAKLSRAIDGSRGIISQVARRLGVSRTTVRRYMERWPQAGEQLQEEKETIKDVGEVTLYDLAINKQNVRALMFLLKTQAKDRGYYDKRELAHTGAGFAPLESWSFNPLDLSAEALAELMSAIRLQRERLAADNKAPGS